MVTGPIQAVFQDFRGVTQAGMANSKSRGNAVAGGPRRGQLAGHSAPATRVLSVQSFIRILDLAYAV